MINKLLNKNFYVSLLSFVGIILLSLVVVYLMERFGGLEDEGGNAEFVIEEARETGGL